MATALDQPGVQTTSLPGGNFTAIQEDDSTWTIKAVPILAEMEPGRRSNEGKIDAQWMLAAIYRHRQLEEENQHLAAVHELHHDPGVVPQQIGFLRLSHVGRLPLNGKRQDVLFADIVRVRDRDLQRMRDIELPFRSIEIPRDWRPEISSLALMGTESPEHKLPMLTIGDEVPNAQIGYQNTVALGERGDSIFLQYGAKEMPDEDKKDEDLQEPEDKKEEDLSDDDELEAKLTKMVDAAVASALAAKFQENGDEEEEKNADDDDDEDADDEDDDDKAPAESNSSKTTTVAKLRGRISALEKRDRDRSRSDKRTTLVDNAVAKLRDSGREVDDQVRDDMVKLAATSEKPAETLRTFVDSYQRAVPEDPPEDVEMLGARGFLTGDETIENVSEDVLKFRSRGPDVLARAAERGREYDELKASGMNFSISRGEYIDLNIEEPAGS